MIETKSLSFSYDGIRQLSFPDFACDNGASFAILGPSGSGKTTFLHLMAGLLQPKAGEVRIAGQNIAGLKGGKLREFRSRRLGLLFQVPHFMSALSMKDNLLLTQKLAGKKSNPREIQDYFNELEMGHRLEAKPEALSQGELQRASLVRAIINAPDVLLADEPTSALDDVNTDRVMKILKRMAEQHGSALVIVTHDNRIKDRVDQSLTLRSHKEQA